jgi:hypothetical protein
MVSLLSQGTFLDALFGRCIQNDAVDIDAGGVDVVWIQFADGDDVFYFGDGGASAGGCHGIEVAGGLAVDQVAAGVGLPGLDQRDVGVDGPFEEIGDSVEFPVFFTFGDRGADAGAGEEAGDAGSTGAHAFGERALRAELDLEVAGEELALEFGVLSDVAGDHLLDLPGLQQQAQAPVVDPGVVAGDGEALGSSVAQRQDQGLGNAAEAEAADRERHAVEDDVGQRRRGVGIDLVHACREVQCCDGWQSSRDMRDASGALAASG